MTKGEDFFFVFLIDRSGSMAGKRMEVAKDAMKLFIQSIPVGSKFQIISFGSASSKMNLFETDSEGRDGNVGRSRKVKVSDLDYYPYN